MSQLRTGVNSAEANRNTLYGAGRVYDIHPRLDELREQGPVVPGGIVALLDPEGLTDARPMGPADAERVTVVGFREVEQIFRDAATFSSEHGYGVEVARAIGAN